MPSRVAEILMEQGRAAARARELSGQIWGSTVARLGEIPLELQQRERQRRVDELREREFGLQEKITGERLRSIEDARMDDALTAELVQQHSHLDPDSGHVVIDHDAINTGLVAKGRMKAAERYMDFGTKYEERLNTIQNQHLATEHAKMKLRADVLGGIANASEDQREGLYATMHGALSPLMRNDPVIGKLPPEYPGHEAFATLYQQQLTDEQRYTRHRQAGEDRLKGLKEVPPGGKLVQVDPDTGKTTVIAEGGQKLDTHAALARDAATVGTPTETPTAKDSAKALDLLSKQDAGAKTGSFEDYVTRWASEHGKPPSELTTQDVNAALKSYHEAERRPPVNITVGGTGALTPEGVDYAATQYRVTGRMPPMRAAIINAAAAQARGLGQAPVVAIQRQAAYKGDTAALQQMKRMAAGAEAFETKAVGQTAIIRELSAKVPRTQWPIINTVLQAGRTTIAGKENATKLANAIETFTEEYAKIMNGATGSVAASTDSSRAAAKRLINTSLNQGTMGGVLDLMTREMQLTLDGYAATIDHITTRMGGASAEPPSTTPPPGGANDIRVGGTFNGKKILKIEPVR